MLAYYSLNGPQSLKTLPKVDQDQSSTNSTCEPTTVTTFSNYIPYVNSSETQNSSQSEEMIDENFIQESAQKHLSHSFHYNFNSLKKQLNLENTRKTHLDSLLKKAKSKCLKAVHEALKNCVNLIVGRLPQDFITNVKIDFNQKYLNKTIGDIYFEFGLLPSINEIMRKNLIRQGKYYLLKEIMGSKLARVFKIYLESDLFKKDFERIKLKDGEEISSLYEFVAKNMCEYFLFSKGNKKKPLSVIRRKSKKLFLIKPN